MFIGMEKQILPNKTRFMLKSKNGRFITCEIFDYNGYHYFYKNIKNKKRICSMIDILQLYNGLQNNIIKLIPNFDKKGK